MQEPRFHSTIVTDGSISSYRENRYEGHGPEMDYSPVRHGDDFANYGYSSRNHFSQLKAPPESSLNGPEAGSGRFCDVDGKD